MVGLMVDRRAVYLAVKKVGRKAENLAERSAAPLAVQTVQMLVEPKAVW